MNMPLRVGELVGGAEDPFVTADRGPVRFIVINRPHARNALTRQMRRDFPSVVAAADSDPAIAVVVLTGMDPAFSAGVDLKDRLSGGPAPLIVPNPAEVLRAVRKPVIAAVNGACTTGALEMALSCSFVIASEQARFADTHAKLGIVPRWGQIALLPRAIGRRRATQFMLTGEFIDARTALTWGLANEVVAPDALLDRCLTIAMAIAGANPECIGLELAAIRRVEAAAAAEGFDFEREALASYDASAGMSPKRSS